MENDNNTQTTNQKTYLILVVICFPATVNWLMKSKWNPNCQLQELNTELFTNWNTFRIFSGIRFEYQFASPSFLPQDNFFLAKYNFFWRRDRINNLNKQPQMIDFLQVLYHFIGCPTQLTAQHTRSFTFVLTRSFSNFLCFGSLVLLSTFISCFRWRCFGFWWVGMELSGSLFTSHVSDV